MYSFLKKNYFWFGDKVIDNAINIKDSKRKIVKSKSYDSFFQNNSQIEQKIDKLNKKINNIDKNTKYISYLLTVQNYYNERKITYQNSLIFTSFTFIGFYLFNQFFIKTKNIFKNNEQRVQKQC